ncbi:MAG TPA: DUF3800 domain-containing protein [Tepidisphaeraceae bacterium]|jgi:hypothetical protein
MLLFIDESGHDHHEMPCEVLAGVAVSEDNLWNLIQAIRSSEKDHFGDYLRNLRVTEMKAKRLLKRKRFKSASRPVSIPEAELVSLAHSALKKGIAASEAGKTKSNATERELVAYSRCVSHFVDDVLDIAARHSVQVFASVVDIRSPRPAKGLLRKDYVYLFERYFYFLETLPPRERGLIVFDELDKAKAHILIQQMAAYFLGTKTGRYRSSRVVPEPFFVHSDLTTGVFLADLTAYILGWGWRLRRMAQPRREELAGYAQKLHDMQFHGDKIMPDGSASIPLHGIIYLDDLRGQSDRDDPNSETEP